MRGGTELFSEEASGRDRQTANHSGVSPFASGTPACLPHRPLRGGWVHDDPGRASSTSKEGFVPRP
ncbi:MAG: hypothetical protein MZU97_18875 [Bacillus subtilis]|nr:hypothetical protein [Bacillus subtilis]